VDLGLRKVDPVMVFGQKIVTEEQNRQNENGDENGVGRIEKRLPPETVFECLEIEDNVDDDRRQPEGAGDEKWILVLGPDDPADEASHEKDQSDRIHVLFDFVHGLSPTS
jgi:hypothetical protein